MKTIFQKSLKHGSFHDANTHGVLRFGGDLVPLGVDLGWGSVKLQVCLPPICPEICADIRDPDERPHRLARQVHHGWRNDLIPRTFTAANRATSLFARFDRRDFEPRTNSGS
ncbi:MAG TPA: hypothetical protein VN736_10560 [Candidatus Limnocylindrales bacterium]|nr:hypothetical protein [Candidatus Limnocylindrales bacterium]